MEEILTSEQVSQILQVHPFTVLKFIKQGKLKASKLGRVYRIRKSDVDKFLDDQVEQKESTSKSPEKKAKPEPTPKKEKKKKITVEKKTDIAKVEAPKETQVQPEQVEPKRRSNNSDIDHYILELKKIT